MTRFLRLDPAEASFARRGFPDVPGKREHLEAIGEQFIAGYNAALEHGVTSIVDARLSAVDAPLRGFTVEGAAMATALCDGLFLIGRRRLPAFLAAARPRFPYLAHVGVGWAMARLPWYRATLRSRLDPLIASLAFDGWGFHDTYFHFARVMKGRRPLRDTAARAYDQGVGRGLWFAAAASPLSLIAQLRRFDQSRHADLWAGVGLAAAYAGGATAGELRQFFVAAGVHQRWLRQGAAFAAEAHALAGWIPAHADLACSLWNGRSAAGCVDLVRDARERSVDRPEPYEHWRAATAAALATSLREVS
jgi:hypothetical protein